VVVRKMSNPLTKKILGDVLLLSLQGVEILIIIFFIKFKL